MPNRWSVHPGSLAWVHCVDGGFVYEGWRLRINRGIDPGDSDGSFTLVVQNVPYELKQFFELIGFGNEPDIFVMKI